VYKLDIRKEEAQRMDIDPGRTTSQDIIPIGTIDILVEKDGKRPVVLNDPVDTSTYKGCFSSNDHEASGSGSKSRYILSRSCPPGLAQIQRMKLQRFRFWEKKENELKKQWNEMFNLYMSIIP
jgi:hypothetical protein